MKKLKQTATFFIKITVSLVLLVYLFSTTDMRALALRVRGGDTLLLTLAIGLYAVVIAVSTWRWRVLLRAQGYPAPLRHLSASYLVATFFNNFLPSNIGGDLVRVRDGKQLTGSTTSSLAVVAIDRVLGFGALYILAALAYLVGGPAVRRLAGAHAVILLLGLSFSILAYIFFRPGTARKLMAVSRLSRIRWAQDRFETVQSAVHVYREQIGSVWLAFLGSLALQTVLVVYYYAVAHALRIDLPLDACFLMVPLCNLIQAVPISFNGWGLREGVFVVYFGQLGLTQESALAFSILGAGLIVLLSLSGAVVWTTRRACADPEVAND
ncbi:MAG: flippase-like domain-containing protein [Vicinamibacteria bacterium]|nr:flippase-like domain-containing protein [Vicinamibacteria bacterium]